MTDWSGCSCDRGRYDRSVHCDDEREVLPRYVRESLGLDFNGPQSRHQSVLSTDCDLFVLIGDMGCVLGAIMLNIKPLCYVMI